MQVYLCNLRQTIKSLKARELHLSDNLIYSFKDENKSEFMNCMQEQIRSKIPVINNFLKKEQIDSLLMILFLRMFGIKLSEHYFEKFNIFRHHLIRLSDLDLISVDDPEYLHEEAATELLINIYKTFGNHIQSFDHEYQIQEKINLLLSNLQYNDFLNVFSKCESLFEDKDKEQHRYPLGHLVLMLFKIPDYLMDKENKFNLYKAYTHGLGNFYYHIGDYVKSIEYHDKAIALDNNNPDAYDGKGISLSRLGENYEAIKQYNKAIENDPTHPNAHYNKAISLYNLEDDPNAIKEFNKAIRLNPSDPDAHYFKALCLHRLGKDKNALNEYSKAIEIDPFYKNAYIGRGSSYAQLGKDKRAITDFDEAIAIDPQDGIAYFNKALSLSKLGRFEESIISYDKFLDIDPQNAMAHYNKGCSLLYVEKFKEAIVEFDKTIDIDPPNAMAHYNKATALSITGFKLEAIAEFDKAIDIIPDYIKAYDGKGMALSELGKEENAIAEFDKAIEIDPTYANAHYNKALSLSLLKRFDESIVEYDEAIKYEPDFVVCYYSKAISQKDKGDHKEAIRTLKTLLDIDTLYLKATDQIAWIMAHYFPQQIPEILPNLSQIVAENPNVDFLVYTFAFCLDIMGKYEAINFYSRLILLAPELAIAYFDCARSMIKSNPQDIAGCLSYLEKALKLDPELKERVKTEMDFESIKNGDDFNKLFL